MRKPKPVEKSVEPDFPNLNNKRKIWEVNFLGVGGRVILSAALIATLSGGCGGSRRRLPGEMAIAPKEPIEMRTSGALARVPSTSAQEGTIHFDFDKYRIRTADMVLLEKMAEQLKATPDMKIIIEGHCDEQGSAEYNIALGAKRANAAREFLVSRGIDVKRISTISYGEEHPVDPGHSQEAMSKNRRAEIKPGEIPSDK